MTELKTQLWDIEATWSQQGAGVEWQWPLLVLTQTEPQKQPRSLTVAALPQLIPCDSLEGKGGRGWGQ